MLAEDARLREWIGESESARDVIHAERGALQARSTMRTRF